MLRPHDSAAVLFPGALGDFICFLPTLHALRARHTGQLLLVAKPEQSELIAPSALATASIDRRAVADLFVADGEVAAETLALLGGFAHVYSWTGFGNTGFTKRLAAASGGRVMVYRFRGMQPGEHAVDYYACCVGLSACPIAASIIRRDEAWLRAFDHQRQLQASRLLVLHAGSGSASKNWRGFGELIRYWRNHYDDSIVLLRGPAEVRATQLSPAPHVSVDDLTLSQVAALLGDCALYLGNDSGISHLAGAIGARGVVLFGASDPAVWAPRSDRLRVLHAPTPCVRCGPTAFCVHRLSVETVIDALEAQRAAALTSVQL